MMRIPTSWLLTSVLFLILTACAGKVREIPDNVEKVVVHKIEDSTGQYSITTTDAPSASGILVEIIHRKGPRIPLVGKPARRFVSFVVVDGDQVSLFHSSEVGNRRYIPAAVAFLPEDDPAREENQRIYDMGEAGNFLLQWNNTSNSTLLWRREPDDPQTGMTVVTLKGVGRISSFDGEQVAVVASPESCELTRIDSTISFSHPNSPAKWSPSDYVQLSGVHLVGQAPLLEFERPRRLEFFLYDTSAPGSLRHHHSIDLVAHGQRYLVTRAVSDDGRFILFLQWSSILSTTWYLYDTNDETLTSLGAASSNGFKFRTFSDAARKAAMDTAVRSVMTLLEAESNQR